MDGREQRSVDEGVVEDDGDAAERARLVEPAVAEAVEQQRARQRGGSFARAVERVGTKRAEEWRRRRACPERRGHRRDRAPGRAFGARRGLDLDVEHEVVAQAKPGWKNPLIFGWAGMRGVVSLAAALSIPVLLANGQPFPFRNLILFITFIVILVTLVIQGLTLPWLIRKLHPEDLTTIIPEERQETIIQMKLAKASLRHLNDKYNGKFPSDHLTNLHQKLNLDLHYFEHELKETGSGEGGKLNQFYHTYLDLLEQQRKMLHDMNALTEFDEDIIRKYMGLTDIEELKVRQKLAENKE